MRDVVMTGIVVYWCVLGASALVVHTIEHPTVARDVPRVVERQDPYVYVRPMQAVGAVPDWFADMTMDALEEVLTGKRPINTGTTLNFSTPIPVARF